MFTAGELVYLTISPYCLMSNVAISATIPSQYLQLFLLDTSFLARFILYANTSYNILANGIAKSDMVVL